MTQHGQHVTEDARKILRRMNAQSAPLHYDVRGYWRIGMKVGEKPERAQACQELIRLCLIKTFREPMMNERGKGIEKLYTIADDGFKALRNEGYKPRIVDLMERDRKARKRHPAPGKAS